MAGGDGSQAIVAAVAAELDLPYACVPAGTRNHFALDLGVDRDDVVGALDAFVDGGERRVDLAEVNGRVFVNNVSLGLYAEAVQRPGYREAKIRTILDTVPDMLGRRAAELDLRWRGPADTSTARGRRCWSRTTATGSGGGRVGHAAADRRRPARHHGRSAPARDGSEPGRSRSVRGANGRLRSSRSTPSGRSRRHRRRGGDRWRRRCDSGSDPASCASASHGASRAPPPRRRSRRASWRGSSPSSESRRGRAPGRRDERRTRVARRGGSPGPLASTRRSPGRQPRCSTGRCAACPGPRTTRSSRSERPRCSRSREGPRAAGRRSGAWRRSPSPRRS